MWAKIPAATASIACAACVAAAVVAAPTASKPGSEQLNKIISEQINLTAIDVDGLLGALSALDSTSGIPPLVDTVLQQNPSLLVGYDALSTLGLVSQSGVNGILSVAAFDGLPGLMSGDITGLAAFDGIPSLMSGDITGIDAFSGIPNYSQFLASGGTDISDAGLGGIDAFSGLQHYAQFLASGGTDISDAGLGGIDAFSGLQHYVGVAGGGGIDSLGNIDAFSALPTYRDLLSSLNADTAPPEAAPAAVNASLASIDPGTVSDEQSGTTGQPSNPFTAGLKRVQSDVKNAQAKVQSAVEPAAVADQIAKPKVGLQRYSRAEAVTPDTTTPQRNVTQNLAPQGNITAPAASTPDVSDQKQAAPEPKFTSRIKKDTEPSSSTPSNGSYSGSFSPNRSQILFGTGGGGNADNGMRGWDKIANGVRGALGMGKQKSSSDSGSSGAGSSSAGSSGGSGSGAGGSE